MQNESGPPGLSADGLPPGTARLALLQWPSRRSRRQLAPPVVAPRRLADSAGLNLRAAWPSRAVCLVSPTLLAGWLLEISGWR